MERSIIAVELRPVFRKWRSEPMSIDRANRDMIADGIERYLRCEIDNYELDDIHFNGKDRAAYEICQEVWFFYDDFKRHKNKGKYKLPESDEARLRRWVLFLRSDSEWPIDEPDRRWKKPPGCILALIYSPKAIFDTLLGLPRPRSENNEYWPLNSLEDWTRFASDDSD
jgi:hypothetical protein